jgi:hypothetical protein
MPSAYWLDQLPGFPVNQLSKSGVLYATTVPYATSIAGSTTETAKEEITEGQLVMEWLFLIVPVVSVAVVIWLRRTAAKQVGLPSMTPFKLSEAVSQANKLGRDTLSVTLARPEAARAIGPMGAIGWQVNTATSDRTVPRSKKAAVVFSRVPAVPRSRYEYLYDRDTWVRRPPAHQHLADGSTEM